MFRFPDKSSLIPWTAFWVSLLLGACQSAPVSIEETELKEIVAEEPTLEERHPLLELASEDIDTIKSIKNEWLIWSDEHAKLISMQELLETARQYYLNGSIVKGDETSQKISDLSQAAITQWEKNLTVLPNYSDRNAQD